MTACASGTEWSQRVWSKKVPLWHRSQRWCPYSLSKSQICFTIRKTVCSIQLLTVSCLHKLQVFRLFKKAHQIRQEMSFALSSALYSPVQHWFWGKWHTLIIFYIYTYNAISLQLSKWFATIIYTYTIKTKQKFKITNKLTIAEYVFLIVHINLPL